METGATEVYQSAIRYIHAVQDRYPDNPEVFDEFLDIIRDGNENRVDLSTTILRLEELFEGNQQLVEGFNAFLPGAYGAVEVHDGVPARSGTSAPHTPPSSNLIREISSPGKNNTTLGDYMLRIRHHYQRTNPAVYQDFQSIVADYVGSLIDLPDVVMYLAGIFKGNFQLVEQFQEFLPDGYHIEFEVSAGSPTAVVLTTRSGKVYHSGRFKG
ncbi:hypothetical protein D9757_003896 [Collybiopsis confluens]|uniref:Uncharacterized protein n=1 Tax=Collybiopsis confluens TaxID=2823264 RepID=A0A8H5HV37_9AGAR|nr:hypothetical protein D9757_003896 [Collybiopsis confluens]